MNIARKILKIISVVAFCALAILSYKYGILFFNKYIQPICLLIIALLIIIKQEKWSIIPLFIFVFSEPIFMSLHYGVSLLTWFTGVALTYSLLKFLILIFLSIYLFTKKTLGFYLCLILIVVFILLQITYSHIPSSFWIIMFIYAISCKLSELN